MRHTMDDCGLRNNSSRNAPKIWWFDARFSIMVKLARIEKMIDLKYWGIEKEQISTIQKNGMTIKVIAGKIDGMEGPVCDLTIDIEYFYVKLASSKTFEHASHGNNVVFVYVVNVSIEVHDKIITLGHCVVFGER